MAKGQSNDTRHQRVLGGTVDEGAALEDCRDGKHGAGGNLSGAGVDGAQDVVGGVVDA